MDEEKPKKGEGEKTPTEDTGTGDQPEGIGLIDKANIAAERLEKANEEQDRLLRRQEEMMAAQKLAGTAEAGIVKPKEPPMSDQDYAKALMKGDVDPFAEDEN